MFPIFLALLLSGVVECGRRPTDPNTLTALAAAEQRRQQLHSTREDRQARARKRTRVQHLAQHLEQQSQPGNATNRHREQQPRVGGYEQLYGAQAFRGAVQKDCSLPELLAHMTHSC